VLITRRWLLALDANTEGTENVAVGKGSSINTTGDNTAVGALSLDANTTGDNNTALGEACFKF
jgi:trimeric autotransporter adhesin